jgi:hypothetical protein
MGRGSPKFDQRQRGGETEAKVGPRGGTTLGKNVRNGINRNAVVARPGSARRQNPVGVFIVWPAGNPGLAPQGRANPGLEDTAPLGLERHPLVFDRGPPGSKWPLVSLLLSVSEGPAQTFPLTGRS